MRNKYIPLLFLFIPVLLFADDDLPILKQLQEKVNQFLEMRGEESIYVSTDKPLYAAGEDVWLSAFVVDATTNKPTTISDVANVIVKDPKGNIVKQLKLEIKNGVAAGDFNLKADGPSGIYTIEAYTQWMQNFGEDRIFKKEIHVQKVIVPNLLLRVDFEKKAYGSADEVTVNFKVSDLENKPAATSLIRVKVNIDGATIDSLFKHTDNEGMAKIKFTLPENLKSIDAGILILADYNGVKESIYRTIPIVLNKINLAFFPEGGNLVSEIDSRIAFKAVNEFGKGADISGEIVDEIGIVVTKFESLRFGMGTFKLKAQKDKKYFARITRPVANYGLIELPQAEETYSLNLHKQDANKADWTIYAPNAGLGAITVQVHGVMHHSQTVNLKEGLNRVEVSTNELPAGIAVFTLFDSNGIEQCERLLFVNNDKKLNISIETDYNFYKPLDRINLRIKTTDEKGNPAPAKLSLSVVDDRLLAFADDRQDNMLSYLLLSSELKGKIDEPNFYFKPDEKHTKEAIDYLLLTHGWRRFTWKDIKGEIKKPAILPENNSTIVGFVTNKKGIPQKSKVTLIEKSGEKRYETIETANEGQFIFYNVDPKATVILMTEYPNQINIWEAPSIKIQTENKNSEAKDASFKVSGPNYTYSEENNKSKRSIKYDNGEVTSSEYIRGNSGNYTGGGGGLSEMVIVGYGKRYTGLFTSDHMVFYSNMELENTMTGQKINIDVEPPNANIGTHYVSPENPGARYNANKDMLVVINGVPTRKRTNNHFTIAGAFDMDDLTRIEVINSADAVSKYGMEGANGAIEIKTSTDVSFKGASKPIFHRPKYNGFEMSGMNTYHRAQEFYQHRTFLEARDKNRSKTTTTVHWQGEVETGESGMTEISFLNNDVNSAFRITAEGLGMEGLIGREEKTYVTSMPLSLDMKPPHYMNFEDELRIPVYIKNTTSEKLDAVIDFNVYMGSTLKVNKSQTVTVEANHTHTIYYSITSEGCEGKYDIEATLSGICSDTRRQSIEVFNVGFPKTVSLSGKSSRNLNFNFDNVVPGTLKGQAQLNLNILDDLVLGKNSIIQRPYGCFEQVSSANYPNILAARWYHDSRWSGYEINQQKEKLYKYLEEAYQKLCSYEIKGGGFEWFGNPPAHTTLTAYGMMQFHEMKDIYPKIDIDMLDRTVTFLMNQRVGDGTFKQHRGKYGFSAAPKAINNAYVTFALSEIGINEIETEYTHALNEVLESKDMYRMALMANAAYNQGKTDDYKRLVDLFISDINNNNLKKLQVEGSVVYSSTARLEAVAHWTIAMLKAGKGHIEAINTCIDYISENRSGGGFGSTQATAICLKALTNYAKITQNDKLDEDALIIKLNGREEVLKTNQKSSVTPRISSSFFEENIKDGGNELSAIMPKEKLIPPYSIHLKWYTRTPEKHPDCPYILNAKLTNQTVKLNETVRLEIKMKNTATNGQAMSMIEMGIPAGLSLQPHQLKELKEQGVFDFYEIINNRLAIYFREIGPNEEKSILIDLKADVPGRYFAAASCAYLYYNQDVRYWIDGLKIDIQE